MSTDTAEHIDPSPGAAPDAGLDLLKYLPLLMKVLDALATGTGTFSTATPRGKRWVRIQDKPFDS